MHRATRKEREEFIGLMIQHAPAGGVNGNWHSIRPVIYRLLRYGATYGRIQELWCNGPQPPNGLTPEQYRQIDRRYEAETVPYYERKETQIEKAVRELCASIGCGVVFQGDPRGATVKITFPDGFINDWRREGLCVPTS